MSIEVSSTFKTNDSSYNQHTTVIYKWFIKMN